MLECFSDGALCPEKWLVLLHTHTIQVTTSCTPLLRLQDTPSSHTALHTYVQSETYALYII